MVKKSRSVKREKGILGFCGKNKGKVLSETLREEVIRFYEHDDNSRECPGMKDYINVRDKDGERVKHQKRLVLSNVKELFSGWKNLHPEKKIGFSTFASLRPKWCVLAGASGTHSVCVYKHHQNPKLMVAACLKSTTYGLMTQCVCSVHNERCMMGHCNDCPGAQGLIGRLQQSDDLADIENVTYQPWVTMDRTKLVSITESKSDFIENLAEQVSKLTIHSFIATAQSQYMKHLKSSMKPLEDIILQGDFSENYSYVVQDRIQSFHWENELATLHPFVAYRRRADGSLQHGNICVVSDHKDHNAVTVHAFLQSVIPYVKSIYPEVKKSTINLCYRYHFFATSHGKKACDVVGGTVKRFPTKKSFQRPYNDAILTSEAIMSFCKDNILGIEFFNVTSEEVLEWEQKLRET